jgi:hypothetical protein
MDIKQVIQSQYLAALAMLKQVIVKCPQSVWDAAGDKFKFWSKSIIRSSTSIYIYSLPRRILSNGKNTMIRMETSPSQKMKCLNIWTL